MTGPPRCRCDKQAVCLETKKAGPNQGRWFWKCAGSACNYFKWDTSGQFATHSPQVYAAIVPGSSGGVRSHRRDFLQNRSNDPATAHPPQRPAAPTSVQFTLHSRTTIAITASYNPTLLPVLRNLEGATWDAAESKWIIPATQSAYTSALQAMPIHTPNLNLQVDELPPSLVTLLPTTEGQPIRMANAQSEPRDMEERLERVSTTFLWSHLKEFQRTGVEEAIRRNGRMLLADDMGLGKTLQALGVTLAYQDAWPVLIICPSSLRLTWKAEIKKWLALRDDEINVTMKGTHLFDTAASAKRSLVRNLTLSRKRMATARLVGSTERGMSDESDEEEEQDPVKFYVISYDLASRYSAEVAAKRFNFTICDESHYLKSRMSKRYKALAPILQSATRRLLLSGTPVFSRPEELYTQIHTVWPNFFLNFQKYGVRYCNGQQTVFGWDFSGASNLTELNIMMEESVLLRRLKKDVGLELPEKFRQTVFVEAPHKGKSTMRKLRKALEVIEERASSTKLPRSSKEKAKAEQRQMMMDYYVQTGSVKIPVIEEYLNHVLESRGASKMIVFAYHLDVLNAIEETVKKHGVKYIRIDGSTDASRRQQLCDTFQEDSKVQIAVLSLAAANVGLTLSAADIVIFSELFWNPSQLLQAEDRAHVSNEKELWVMTPVKRIGRVGPVDIKYIICMDTLDVRLWQMVQKKLKVVGEAIDGSRTRVNLKLTNSLTSSSQTFGSQCSDESDDENDQDEELFADLEDTIPPVEVATQP